MVLIKNTLINRIESPEINSGIQLRTTKESKLHNGNRTVSSINGLPGGSDSEASACNAGYLGSNPGSGRSPRERNGYPLLYSCLGNSMDRGAWWAAIHGTEKSQMRLIT